MMGYGYENAAGDRISALIDMINGGGPGRSGGTFEGGGILSLLANAVAKPYGSVRERPGHTPVGAAAPMEVLQPVSAGADVAPVETMALPESQSFERSFETEAAAPRYLTEDEAARLANLPESIAPPDLLSFFNGIPPGSELSPQESMILDALLSSASFNPEVQARRGLNRISTAPLVSPRPEARPDAGITIPPYTLALQGQPVAEPSTAPLVSPRPEARPSTAPLVSPRPEARPSTAPLVSPRPKLRPDAALTVPLPLQGPPVPAPDAALTLPPLQGPPVPAPTIAPATAYESLSEPTLFTQDQLEAMSPAMKLMAEEHNRENARLVAEDFRVPAAPLVSTRPRSRSDVLGQETAGVTYPTYYGTIDSLDEVIASLRPAFEQALAAGPDPVYGTSGGDPYFVYSDGRVFDVLNARAGEDPFDVDPSVQDDLRARAGVTGTASR